MNPPAAAELRRRGGDPSGFRARHLTGELVDESDLVLCATSEQVARVLQLRPDARPRTFVLGEFGRLLAKVATTPAVVAPTDPASAFERGIALVAAVDALRAGAGATPEDDLDDPWGLPQHEFARVAGEIVRTVQPLAQALAAARAH